MATRRADATFRACLLAVSGTAILFSLGAFVRAGHEAALSTMLGGAAAVLNLMAMRRILEGVIGGAADGDLGKGRTFSSLAVLKLFGLLVGVSLLLTKGIARPLPFVFGYLALPLGIVIGALLAPPKDEVDADEASGSDDDQNPKI